MIQDDPNNSWSSEPNDSDNSWSSELNSQRSNPNLSKKPSFNREQNSEANDSWGSPNLSKKPSFHREQNSDFHRNQKPEEFNPYGTPNSVIEDDNFNQNNDWVQLAGRGSRLVAVILDLIFVFVTVFIFAMMSGIFFLDGGIIGMILAYIFVLIVQLGLLSQNSQTVGKKVMNIKIVRTNNQYASVGRIIFLRGVLLGIIASIPIIGIFFGLADPLFIFGDEQRCIHDYIADTKVIKA